MASRLKVVDDDSEEFRRRIARIRSGTPAIGDLILSSQATERVRFVAGRAARSMLPILIEGERGVGKETLARAIHFAGARRSRPLVVFSCDRYNEAEIEAALFGGGNGTGKLGAALGGTLFINEIGALPRAIQARLAEYLAIVGQDESGPSPVRRATARLICASSSRVVDLVSAGRFREDLFHRLNVLPIWLPPLRERSADLPGLIGSLLAAIAVESCPAITRISADALETLRAREWAGNLPELERALRRAVLTCTGDELRSENFPAASADAMESLPSPTEPRAGQSRSAGKIVADQRQMTREWLPSAAALHDRMGGSRYGSARLLDEEGELLPFNVLEAEVIRFAVSHYRGRLSEVARRLGIGRSTLYRKIKDYGIASGEMIVP